jgi:hypothetical protein
MRLINILLNASKSARLFKWPKELARPLTAPIELILFLVVGTEVNTFAAHDYIDNVYGAGLVR